MARTLLAMAVALVVGTAAQGALVWDATFDTGPDGVVDIYDGNPNNVMIGPAGGGTIQITTQDYPANYNGDAAGRPLGTTVDGFTSYSGLYNFRWTGLNQDQVPQTYEIVGFKGPMTNQTRQMIGTIIRHWKVGENHYIGLDIAWGNNGSAGHLYDATTDFPGGTAVWIGNEAAATSENWQLAIGYDAGTTILDLGLYRADGTLVASNSANLSTDLNLLGNTLATVLGALQLTHLGWQDYAATGDGRTTTWLVDRLRYFDTADGASNAVPEPASLMLLAGGAALALRRRRP